MLRTLKPRSQHLAITWNPDFDELPLSFSCGTHGV